MVALTLPPYYNTLEAAQYLGLAHRTIHEYIQRGLLEGRRGGREWWFTREELDRYQAEKRPRGNPNFVRAS